MVRSELTVLPFEKILDILSPRENTPDLTQKIILSAWTAAHQAVMDDGTGRMSVNRFQHLSHHLTS